MNFLSPTTEEDQQAAALNPLAWAKTYRSIDEQPFSLERFTPLESLYLDDHPHIVVIKPAQVGVSEWAITRACHALDVGAAYWQTGKAGLNVGYIFPTGDALGDFSKERFSSLKRESQHLADLFGGEFDDIRFKQVGRDSYLYLRSARSESGLLSFPADIIIRDEYDRMSPESRALAEKRLRASQLKFIWDISTPTLPGVGIHAQYLQSDQRVWEVQCQSCERWNDLDFFRDVRADGETWQTWQTWSAEHIRHAAIVLLCPSCGDEIDRFGTGRWMARQPEVTGIRGYHVPWYAFPSVSLEYLAARAIDPDPSRRTEFLRSDLGLPYEPEGSRITDAMLQQLSHELEGGRLPLGPWKNTTMGVDVGALFNYRISSVGPDNAVYVRAMGTVKEWDDLDPLMAQYKVRRVVIDAMPEQHACRDWANKHKGKVLRAYYPNGLQDEPYRVDDEDGTIKINRTMAMDKVFNTVAQAEKTADGAEAPILEHWPAEIHNNPDVKAQMKAPVRVITTDRNGQDRADWVHIDPDHYYHATVYDQAARATLPKSLAGVNLGALQGKTKGWGVSK